MLKAFLISVGALALLLVGFFALNTYIYQAKQVDEGPDYKNAEYVIDGRRVKLIDGLSEIEAAPGSASRIITRYFGNELVSDLNDDGLEDVVFLVTQETGGTGTFFYVVAALNTGRGYIGSQALLLGDRIAPQTTEKGPWKQVVVNYADRAPGEDFSVRPSMGVSKRLIFDVTAMQFGEVANDFEGEAIEQKHTVALDVSRQGLMKVPAYIFERSDIEVLNLSYNSLTGAVQAEIRNLQNLKTLNLSHNQLTGVPAEVGQLTQLEVLDLSHNALTGLPYEIGNLSKLKILDVSGNEYSEADLARIRERLPKTTVIKIQ